MRIDDAVHDSTAHRADLPPPFGTAIPKRTRDEPYQSTSRKSGVWHHFVTGW